MRWLPNVNIMEVEGLIEIIHDNNDKIEVDDLQKILNIELNELMEVIKAAKILNFISTRGRVVKLTKDALNLLKLNAEERKEMIAMKIKKLEIFKKILNILKKTKEITYDQLIDILSEELPERDAEEEAKVIIDWGQYAELFDYDIKIDTIKTP